MHADLAIWSKRQKTISIILFPSLSFCFTHIQQNSSGFICPLCQSVLMFFSPSYEALPDLREKLSGI